MTQEEDDFWTGKILEAQQNQLETVRKAGTAWSALFTAVLGVFITVTFASGLTGLNGLSEPVQTICRVGVVIAAIAIFIAATLAGSVANSNPRLTNDLTIDSYRADSKSRAIRALNRLHLSMLFGVLAAVVIISNSLIVLFAHKAESENTPLSAVVVMKGEAYCGVLMTTSDGSLAIGKMPVKGATSLTIVERCPKRP